MKAQRIAALDLGSNSFLCLICEVRGDQVRTLSDQVEIVRLGEGIATTGKFSEAALVRASECLARFSKTIQEFGCDKVQAVATAAARKAENAHELQKICDELRIPIEIISGEEEARLTYLGAVALNGDGKGANLLIDIGGGSTEFVVGRGRELKSKVSVPWGCVNTYEKLQLQTPNSSENLQALEHHVKSNFTEAVDEAYARISNSAGTALQILAVAGTPTTLATVQIGSFDEEKINALEFTEANLQAWFDKLSPLDLQRRIELGFPKGRADVIIVGIAILKFVLKKFTGHKMKVSTRGLRNGLMAQLMKE